MEIMTANIKMAIKISSSVNPFWLTDADMGFLLADFIPLPGFRYKSKEAKTVLMAVIIAPGDC
jgi:hypothetical protein